MPMLGLTIPILDSVAFVVVLLILYSLLARVKSSRARYPPGPKGLPFIGNLRIPTDPVWMKYREWGKQYDSDVLHLRVLRKNIIILNSFETAVDLLGKRSSTYSDRPSSNMVMLKELCGLKWNIGLLPYGREWRDSRKIFKQELGVHTVQKYRPILAREVHKLLVRILRDPERFWEHTHSWSAGQIIAIAYGIEIQGNDDPHVVAAEHAAEAVGLAVNPGSYLVDFIPLLQHVPLWVPGAKFQRDAKFWRRSITNMRDRPWDDVKQRLTSSRPSPISAAKSLTEAGLLSEQGSKGGEELAKSTLGSMYLAGSESTLTVLRAFLLAMLLNPDILRRARQSVDCVCKNRLPSFDDYDDLPYVHAIVKECLRWSPVVTLNVAHQCTEDDIYRGFFIPRGSIVIANIRAMFYDPQVYPDPERFHPERFLKPSPTHPSGLALEPTIRDPMDIAFGFGRRSCPGRYMAYESLWLAIASMLATFNIGPETNASGCPAPPRAEFEDGLVCRPKPFMCRLSPRSASYERSILSAYGFDRPALAV